MNKSTLYIKRCILKHPSIFRCRYDVLEHMFAVLGTGFYWINGELVYDLCDKDEDPVETMDFSDLDKRLERHKQELKKYDQSELIQSFIYADELERLERVHILNNIDLVASSIHARSRDSQYKERGYYINSPCHDVKCPYFKIPADVTDEYKNLAEEFGKEWCSYFMRRNQGFHQMVIKTGKEPWVKDFSAFKLVAKVLIDLLPENLSSGYAGIIGSVDPKNKY